MLLLFSTCLPVVRHGFVTGVGHGWDGILTLKASRGGSQIPDSRPNLPQAGYGSTQTFGSRKEPMDSTARQVAEVYEARMFGVDSVPEVFLDTAEEHMRAALEQVQFGLDTAARERIVETLEKLRDDYRSKTGISRTGPTMDIFNLCIRAVKDLK